MKEGRAFFDTNILIYSFDANSPRKRDIAKALVDSRMSQGNAVVSFQVLQEFVNVMRKGRVPLLSIDACTLFVSSMMKQCEMVRPSEGMILRGLEIHQLHQVSWYDSLIVAAAQLGDCPILYSEDLSHLQKYDGVQVVNPFL